MYASDKVINELPLMGSYTVLSPPLDIIQQLKDKPSSSSSIMMTTSSSLTTTTATTSSTDIKYPLPMSEFLKRKAIDRGKLFPLKSRKLDKLIPQPQCDYKMTFISLQYLRCRTEVDVRAVVSLALLNHRSPILEAYGNKLFIMSINVSRLMYTLEAFTFKNQNTDQSPPIQQALEFYVRTDIKHRDKTSPPNKQFSDFLHRLKSSGYIEYIFDLAREINLNVDYIIDARIAARYIKKECQANKEFSSVIGYLTVIHESNNEWYVKTTKEPILA